MMEVCCVEGCRPARDALYHKFPKQANLKRMWLDIIPLRDDIPKTPTICSKHFLPTDYKEVRGRKILNAEVTPTVFNKSKTNRIHTDNNHVTNDISADSSEVNKTDNDESRTRKSLRINDIDDKSNDTNDKKGSPEKNTTTYVNSEINEKENTNKKQEKEIKSKKRKKKITNNIENKKISTDKKVISTSKQSIAEKNGVKEAENGIVNDKDSLNSNDKTDGKNDSGVNNSDRVNKNDAEMIVEALDPDFDQRLDLEDNIPSFILIQESTTLPRTIDIEVPPLVPQEVPVLIENMEVSVDPTLFMNSSDPQLEPDIEILDSDDDEIKNAVKEPVDPISLLTSSDEDDVILQEPNYETIEVSDGSESDDDQPLKNLILRKSKENHKKYLVDNLMSKITEYYCVICSFTTGDNKAYQHHKKLHNKILLCTICTYKTTKANDYKRHMSNHSKEKRFKCHLCSYKARHQMSLIFHLKNHEEIMKCTRCPFKTKDKEKLAKHESSHDTFNYICSFCNFKCKKKEVFDRHFKTHGESDSD